MSQNGRLHRIPALKEDPVSCFQFSATSLAKMFQCVLCDKVYTQHRHLRRHVKLCHKTVDRIPSLKEDPVEWFQCSVCPGKYRNKRLLRRHNLISHGNVVEKRKSSASCNRKKTIVHYSVVLILVIRAT